MDLAAIEEGLRVAVLAVGARLLGKLLAPLGRADPAAPTLCSCGQAMHSVGLQTKELVTLLGQTPWVRRCRQCAACHKTRFPGDEQLGVVDTGFSPAVRRRVARLGSQGPFGQASDNLQVLAELKISAKDCQRISAAAGQLMQRWEAAEAAKPGAPCSAPIAYLAFDGTGVPMRRAELVDRKGKQPDGTAKTREVKLGCCFTQTTTDEEGYAVRDPDTTSYLGAIETSGAFGWRLLGEVQRRGLDRAKTLVALTDGATYNHTLVEKHFPTAVHIVDLFHSREHLYDLSKLLGLAERKCSTVISWLALLDAGRIDDLVSQITPLAPAGDHRHDVVQQALQYFITRKANMDYKRFRALGYFVGSGVIEAGCRTVVGQRLKCSGMHWSVVGANAIITVRCLELSGRAEDFWTDFPQLMVTAA